MSGGADRGETLDRFSEWRLVTVLTAGASRGRRFSDHVKSQNANTQRFRDRGRRSTDASLTLDASCVVFLLHVHLGGVGFGGRNAKRRSQKRIQRETGLNTLVWFWSRHRSPCSVASYAQRSPSLSGSYCPDTRGRMDAPVVEPVSEIRWLVASQST